MRKNPYGNTGSIAALRWELEECLRRVAPIQYILFRPKFIPRLLSPVVLEVRLVGMKYLTTKQMQALETAVDDARPITVSVILTFGSERA